MKQKTTTKKTTKKKVAKKTSVKKTTPKKTALAPAPKEEETIQKTPKEITPTDPDAPKQKIAFSWKRPFSSWREVRAEKRREKLEKDIDKEKQRLSNRPPVKKKEKREHLSRLQRRRNLESYLSKAGYADVSLEKFKHRVNVFVASIISLLWFIPFVLLFVNQRPLIPFLWYTLALWTVVLAFVWLIVWGVLYFYLEMRMYNRRKELEEVLPDFLQLTSANISAGMPIDRALWLAIRPNFGVLAKEIEDVAKATLSGEDLSESLTHLVERYDSVLLKRSISILLEGLSSGGELADLLSKIALNIQEIKIMKKEMAANVTTYAIFISFSSVAIAPVLFALATQLVVIIIGITSNLDIGGSSGAISVSVSSDSSIIENFRIYCYAMLTITAGMSAAIISVITRGNVRDGIRNIPIFIIVSLVIYAITSSAFGALMGGMF